MSLWKRVPQHPSGQRGWFPSKYGFTEYLKKPDDFVETYANTKDEHLKIHFAAHAWAYWHGFIVKVKRRRMEGGWGTRVTLLSRRRFRKEKHNVSDSL